MTGSANNLMIIFTSRAGLTDWFIYENAFYRIKG